MNGACPTQSGVNFVQMIPWFVAAVAVYISGLQYLNAYDKLRLDLYNRRFSIYNATLDFYHAIHDKTTEQANDMRFSYVKYMRESKFLFDQGSGIFELIEKINQAFLNSIDYDNARADPEAGKEVIALHAKRNSESSAKLEGYLLDLETKLKPYLDFHHLQGQRTRMLKLLDRIRAP